MKLEMRILINLLASAEIPFQLAPCALDGSPQIWYPSREDNVCDVICHEWSYGGPQGYLEMMGLVPRTVGDDVEGWLTAKEVFKRIERHWNNNRGR